MKNSKIEEKNYYVHRANPLKNSQEYRNFYKGEDVVDYKEILDLGFPTFYNLKRPIYKHKGINNWEIEKLEIPEKLQGVTPTGKFFKTGKNALPTGENIVVIDLDTVDSEPVGLKALSTWFQEHNVNMKDFNTFQVKTASGGVHFYYTYPDGYEVKSNASAFLSHVDVRAKGGIIMLPGSKSEKDGKIGEYKIAGKSVSYIKPIPEKLLKAICEKPKERKAKNLQKTPSQGNTYKEKVKNSILEEVQNSQEGERNSKLYSQACKAGGYGLDYDELLSEILKVSTLEEDEVMITFDSGYKWGLENPIEIPEMKMKTERKQKMEKKMEGLPTITELKKYWIKNSHTIDIKYITEEGKFIVYREEKGIWERIYQNQALKELIKIQEKLLDLYEEKTTEDLDFSRHEAFISRTSWVEDGLKTIKAKNEIVKAGLDRNPEELVVKNGVLNLRTGELGEFKKESLHTKRSPYNYKTEEELNTIPQEKREKFKKILEVLDEDTLNYAQVMFGQSITGVQPKQAKTFWLYSKGQSGKSTVMNLLQEVSGEWAGIQTGNLLSVDSSRFSASSLSGSRVAIVEEAPVGYLDSGKMKILAGSRTASLEKKGVDSYKEEVTWTFIIATNALPKLRKSEADLGTFRRIVIVPFLKTFNKENPSSDSSLFEAYKDEELCELFLHWLVEGSKKWLKNPDSEEDFSFEMVKIMDKWQAQEKEESNPIQGFLSLAIEKEDGAVIELDELFEYFLNFSESENAKSKLSKLKFKKEVENVLDIEVAKDRRAGKFRYSTFKHNVDISNKRAKIFNYSFKMNFRHDYPEVFKQWEKIYK